MCYPTSGSADDTPPFGACYAPPAASRFLSWSQELNTDGRYARVVSPGKKHTQHHEKEIIIVDSWGAFYLPVEHKATRLSGRARTHLQLVARDACQVGIEDDGIDKLALAEVGPGEGAPEDRYVQIGFPVPITFKDHRFEDLGILEVDALERVRRRINEFQCQRWGLGLGHDQSVYDSVEYDMEREESTTSRRARFTKKKVQGNGNGNGNGRL